MSARRLEIAHSAAFLPPDSATRRSPRVSLRARPDDFHERFEALVLAYDCFWHSDGQRILIVGPPPPARLTFAAEPSGQVLTARLHRSESVSIIALSHVPDRTESVRITCADHELLLPVRSNVSPMLAGRRIVFTMSRDNDLAWIAEWADYHVRVQGADCVLIFDNGSTRYAPAEVEARLAAIPGLSEVGVISWPYRYGAPDPAVLLNPYYTLFLQVAAMSVVLRRFGAQAHGILNCDIDELVATPKGQTVFELARASRHGLVVMRGRYIEPLPLPGAPETGRTHRHYGYFRAAAKDSRSPQKKWALDPSRAWVARLGVHPYMHWIHGRPLFSKTWTDGLFYRHFRAIHTGWKDDRANPSVDAGALARDPDLPALFGNADPEASRAGA